MALRLDQPTNALQIYQKAVEKFPTDTSLMVGIARVHDALGDFRDGDLIVFDDVDETS